MPPEYVGRPVWVRRETRLVRVYNTRREQIALHAEAEPKKFTTDLAHLHSRKRHLIERGEAHLLDRCRLLGPQTGTWAEAMFAQRGPQGLRVMLGLLHLAGKHPVAELERAAQVATGHSAWRLRDLKRLMEQPTHLIQLQFLDHPAAGGLPHPAASHSPTQPTSMTQIETTLRQLRLSGLAQTLPVRLQEAAAARLGHAEFLELIFQDELNVRHQRQMERHHRSARVDSQSAASKIAQQNRCKNPQILRFLGKNGTSEGA